MREGSRTGFRPNRARSQRVQSNSVTSLKAGSRFQGMDGRRLNSERRPPSAYRYEINDLKDRCRDKLLDFFIYCVAKRDQRRRFSDAVRALDGEKTENITTHRKGIPQEHQSPPANIYLHEADLWIERIMQERKMEQGKGERSCPLFSAAAGHIECFARHRICRKRGSGEGRTTVLLWHMRWRVWLGNIMEMYWTANPGMTVRPRPWPRGVASSTEL